MYGKGRNRYCQNETLPAINQVAFYWRQRRPTTTIIPSFSPFCSYIHGVRTHAMYALSFSPFSSLYEYYFDIGGKLLRFRRTFSSIYCLGLPNPLFVVHFETMSSLRCFCRNILNYRELIWPW